MGLTASARAGEAQTADLHRAGPPALESRPDDVGRLRPVRLALETLGALGWGTAWYYRNLEFNSRDWELEWDWPSWQRKLTFDAVRLDSNPFSTNAWGHPRAGMVYYSIARGNGAGVLGSLGSTVAATAVWEYVVEYREQVSINDFVTNTVGGIAIGEPLFQLGMLFRRSAPNPVYRGLGALLAPAVAVNDVLDRRRPARAAVDRYGLAREGWHRLALGLGAGRAEPAGFASSTHAVLSLEAELVTMPGYLRPGRHARRARTGSWSGFATQLHLDERGLASADVRTRALLFGRHWQSVGQDRRGRPRGVGLLLGAITEFEYWQRRFVTARRDHLGRMGIVGPHAELAAVAGPLRLRWDLSALLDFAMVHSLAAADAFPAGEGAMRGSLREHGYYFAAGGSGSTRLMVEAFGWDLGGEVHWDRFESIDGKDRYQETIQDDFHLRDERLRLRGGLGVRPVGEWLRLGTDVEQVARTSALPQRTTQARELVGRMTLSAVF